MPRSGKYIGRFAPSPTGPLHAGSMAAALASWLDAKAHGGRWLVRMENIDTPRCVAGADQIILQQLAQCGLLPDGVVLYQHQRHALYQQALNDLAMRQHAYPCACTRADIAAAHARLGTPKQRHQELIYPGTCRPERGGLAGRSARAWRVLAPAASAPPWVWADRRLGAQQQDIARDVGDIVVLRADGLWAYQLAVVVDDGYQGITDVVRGQDLADNTPRQQWLQHLLGLPTPRYLHTPLVLDAHGDKLSKQTGAMAADTSSPLKVLDAAAQVLGLHMPQSPPATPLAVWLAQAVRRWQERIAIT